MELLKERRGTHALGLAQQVAMERGKERQVQHVVELVLPAAMLMPLRRQGRQRMTASLVRQVAMELQERRVPHAVDFVLLVAIRVPIRRQDRQRMTAPSVLLVALDLKARPPKYAVTNSFIARQTNLRMAYAGRVPATRSPPLARPPWTAARVHQTASIDIFSPRTRSPQVWKDSAYRVHSVRLRTLSACSYLTFCDECI